MAAPYINNKYYASFRGLDVRSNDLIRPSANASDMLNADYTKTGAIVKRKGVKASTASAGGAGLGTWADVNLTTGAITNKLIAIDDNLHYLAEHSLNITYSGVGSARAELYLDKDTGNFYLDLLDDEVLVLHESLGTGIEEASPVTLGGLITAINAVSDFAATATGATTISAAFLTITPSSSLPLSIKYSTWTKANAPSASPLATTWAKRDQRDFENASLVNLNGVLFISTGWNDLHKFDGQNFYKAGIPKPALPTTADAAAGNITNSATKYILTYVQKDNKGNIVEGIETLPSAPLNLTSRQVDVTVPNILAASGFNTNCAVVNGGQASVNTIIVTSGHTLKIGDTAYFLDGISSTYVERAVTGIAATTITIAGAAVTVSDLAVISNNLKIAIYRNQSAGDTYALVAEIPNNSFSASQVYRDNKADASLGAEYIEPIKPHGLPPKGKYASAFRNLLLLSGKVDSPNEVFYSDIDGPEFFPPNDNAFNVDTEFGDVVTGISGNNQSFFVFKSRSIHQVSGDLVEDSFRVDRVNAGELGCVSHHTIKEVEGVLFFLSKDGVYAIASNEIAPKEISVNIEPRFTAPSAAFNQKQAVAINWLEKDKYILFLPETDIASGSTLATNNSRLLVFNYFHGSWLEWDSINPMGGMAVLNGELWLTERRNSSLPGGVVYNSYIVKDTGTPQDYSDHSQAIDFSYKTHWESLAEPSTPKKFLRLKVFSLDSLADGIDPAPFTLITDGENDFVPATVFSTVQDFVGGSLGWGLGAWGVESWGSSRPQEAVSKLGSTKARSLRLIFKNSNNLENVYMSGWELEIATPYKMSIKE